MADAAAAPGRGLIRQIGAVSVITGVSQVCFMGANVLLGRHLTPSDLGVWVLANTLIQLTAYLGLFGLNSALVRSVPLADLARYDWQAGIGRVALLSAAITTAVMVGAAVYYHLSPLLAFLLIVAAWLFSLTVAGSALLTIQRRFAISQLLLYLWRPLLLVAGVGLILAKALSTNAILATYVIAGIIQVAALGVALRRSPAGREPLPTARLVGEGLLFFGLFLTGTLMLRLDQLLIAKLVSKAALARYSVAGNIALTGYGVMSLGVAQVLNPRVASGEPLKLGRLTALLLLVGGAAAAVLTLWGTPLIHGLYLHKYNGDFTRLLGLFCLTGLVQVAYVVPSSVLGVRAPLSRLRLFLFDQPGFGGHQRRPEPLADPAPRARGSRAGHAAVVGVAPRVGGGDGARAGPAGGARPGLRRRHPRRQRAAGCTTPGPVRRRAAQSGA